MDGVMLSGVSQEELDGGIAQSCLIWSLNISLEERLNIFIVHLAW